VVTFNTISNGVSGLSPGRALRKTCITDRTVRANISRWVSLSSKVTTIG